MGDQLPPEWHRPRTQRLLMRTSSRRLSLKMKATMVLNTMKSQSTVATMRWMNSVSHSTKTSNLPWRASSGRSSLATAQKTQVTVRRCQLWQSARRFLDDFIRNFLIKMKLNKTLKTFQAEWYELTQKGILSEEDVGVVPDIYLRNQQMDDNVKYLREELEK